MNSAQILQVRPVSSEPYAHVVAEDFLPRDFYTALAATFPLCKPGSGPTGYTCFRGDPEYDALLDIPAWRQLHELAYSQAFVDYILAQFADVFREECVHDLSQARFVDYVEDREDKESRNLRKVEHAADELWVRMDVMQGWRGYDRGPHLDHRRRAATLLLYCSDADAIGMEGGDLQLHGSDRSVAKQVRARENLAAMFPCYNSSWHSVMPITNTREPRNFVQLTLSSSVDLWQPLPEANEGKRPLWQRVIGKAKALTS